MNSRDQVLLEYGSLAEGERKAGQLCPDCDGGSSRERSMVVGMEEGQIWWRCFRASCQFKGKERTMGGFGSSSIKKPTELRPQEVVSPLPQDAKELLSLKWQIEEGMFDWAKWGWCKSYRGGKERLVQPILSPSGARRGETYRSLCGQLPKSIINKTTEEPMICWYRPRKHGKVLVVVEDQASALRLASHNVDAVALCGTLITTDRLDGIKKEENARVYLCLADDATAQAVRYAVLFKHRLPQLIIKALDVDIKDMPEDLLHYFIDEVVK